MKIHHVVNCSLLGQVPFIAPVAGSTGVEQSFPPGRNLIGLVELRLQLVVEVLAGQVREEPGVVAPDNRADLAPQGRL